MVSYNFKFALKSVQFILFGTIFIVVFNYSSATLDTIAVMRQTTVPNLFGRTQMSLPIVIMPILSLMLGWAMRERINKKSFNLHLLSNFVYSVIVVSAVIGALAPFVHQAPMNIVLPDFILFIPVVLLDFFCGWAIIYIPKAIKA